MRDSLVAAVHDLGDPSVYEACRRVRLATARRSPPRCATIRVTAEEAAEWAIENVELGRASTSSSSAIEPVIVSSGLPQLILPVLGREGVELEVRSNFADPVARRLAGAASATRAVPDLRRPLQAALAPGGRPARLRRRRLVGPVRVARRDRVFARDGLAALPRRTGRALRAVRDVCTMSLLRFPEPYDFELSTGRFRAFGTDLANRLVDGDALPRRRRARGADRRARPAASTSSRSTTRRGPVVAQAARRAVRPRRRSTRGPRAIPCSRRSSRGCAAFARRCSPTRSRRSITSITAQQVSLFAAVAIRNRLVERFGEPGRRGVGVSDPRAHRRGERGGARRGRLHAPQGRVRGRARAQRPRPRRARRARRRRGARADHGAARPRPVDRRMVPRAPSRAAACVARRRPRRSARRREISTVSR